MLPIVNNSLKEGATGIQVAFAQGKLMEMGYLMGKQAINAVFDLSTEDAVIACQKDCGLVIDGEIGEKTEAVLQGQPHEKFLKEADIIAVADMLSVDVATVKAVNKVESAGSGYLKDGRTKILFERHINYRELKKKVSLAVANEHKAKRPDICNTVTGGYKGGVAEYPRLAAAKTMDEECALLSASWGLFQIMGFNFKACGFADVFAFVTAQDCCEGDQLKAFAQFILSNKTMHQALKAKDWAKFASLYNGPAYKKNNYDDKLKNAYARFAELQTKLQGA
jgi:peptidoglycan hydrolase-like protein with peptidoglycan-binding domain